MEALNPWYIACNYLGMKKQILSLVLILASSTCAFAAPAKTKAPAKPKVDWFEGNESRTTCDKEGEPDAVVFEMVDEGGGRSDFKGSFERAGVALRKKFVELLENKLVSGTTFQVETDDYIKKAVCVVKVVTEGPVAEGFDKRFIKNLTKIKATLAANKKKMPSYEDAVTNSEKSSAYVNDQIEANRGAVAFIMTMFENR